MLFEDETINIACPNCHHKNSLFVRDVEAKAESHIVCEGCKATVKIEAREFQQRLDQLSQELEEMQRKASHATRRPTPGRRKDSYQI